MQFDPSEEITEMEQRSFFIHYNGTHLLARAHHKNGVYRNVEVGFSLQEVLEKCRKRGDLSYFEGLTEEATLFIHRWMTMYRPVQEYVEGLWEAPDNKRKGPIGFRKWQTTRHSESSE